MGQHYAPNSISQRNRWILAGLFLMVVFIAGAIAAYLGYLPINLFARQPGGIGVTTEPDGEQIGISDGSYAFDVGTDRSDAMLKGQASLAFKKGDMSGAQRLWSQAVNLDPNDGEAHIYLENQQACGASITHITLIVATTLSGNASDLSSGRDNLQGAYIAQQEYNNGSLLGKVKVCLFIANAGGSSSNAVKVAQQIVSAAQHDSTIIGVMSWPYSSYVKQSYAVLTNASFPLPLVSPTASSDQLSNISEYFFHVAPLNKVQAIAGAQYAEQQLNSTHAAVFYDQKDPYSSSLEQDFIDQYQGLDQKQIVAQEKYTVGDTSTFETSLKQAMNATPTPDLIYFAGYASDMSALLTDVLASPASSSIHLMGGDGLYQLGGYTVSSRLRFNNLNFTAFAYPDEWGYLNRQQAPPFFNEYDSNFDPTGSKKGAYGYGRPDNDAMLSYDAMAVLLKGSQNALGNNTSITPKQLRQGISGITGANALQGVSGQISFDSTGNPINKAIVVLQVDRTGHIMLAPTINAVENCFYVNKC